MLKQNSTTSQNFALKWNSGSKFEHNAYMYLDTSNIDFEARDESKCIYQSEIKDNNKKRTNKKNHQNARK